jgi:hypothetical protein
MDDESYYGNDEPFSIRMIGNGSLGSSFTWKTTEGWEADEGVQGATPMGINVDQTLVYTGGSVNDPPAEVRIVGFWFAEQKVWLTVTGTNSWLPSPWYTTNLAVPGSWTNVNPFDRFPLNTTNWTYTIRFPIPTNSRAYFYKVVTTNAP